MNFIFTDLCIFILPVNCLVVFSDLQLREEWRHDGRYVFSLHAMYVLLLILVLNIVILGDCYDRF